MKKKKIAFIITLCAIFILMTGTVCYASEKTDGTDVTEIPADLPNSDSEQSRTETEQPIGENPLAVIFEMIKAHAAEILSALTFIASLLLAYAYKRGLFPILEKGLHSLTDTAKGIASRTEAAEAASEDMKLSFSTQLQRMEETVNGFAAELQTLAKDLDTAMKDAAERKAFNLVLNEQIELLYDIFMSSTLPQYRKDAVGERVQQMKEVLRKNENEESAAELTA